MDDETFPGQLVEYSDHGHEFRYGYGAKGGIILDEDGTKIGRFFVQETGDGDTPLGMYVQAEVTNPHRRYGNSNYVYADNRNGASAYLIGYTDGRDTAAPTDVLVGLTEEECASLYLTGPFFDGPESQDARRSARIKLEAALDRYRGITND